MNLKQHGFGLLEVMVSLGLTGVLAYIVMQQSEMSSKQQAKVVFNQALNTTMNSIQAELAKSENCTATLKNLSYGTIANPTEVLVIRKGIINTVTSPPSINDGPILFQKLQNGSTGVYIEKMDLIKRPLDNKKVLRVHFKPGDVVAGEVRAKKQLGAQSISKDFLISSSDTGLTVKSCQSESTNLLSSACASLPGGIWNDTTQKCEISGIITTANLLPLWNLAGGGIGTIKPADAINGKVTCQKSSKRCSRTNADCSLPACPANHYQGTPWEWDRKQSTWDYACMKSANCMYQSTQAGWMVKP
jgi:type II secretory pathway pseudopilin PulG